MNLFKARPKKDSLAEAYFAGKEYGYSYTCTLSLPAQIEIDIVVRFLNTTPLKRRRTPFKLLISYIRLLEQLTVGKQFSMKEVEAIEVGSKIGLMRVIDRSQNEILLIENSPSFIVSFMLDKIEDGRYQFTINANVLVTNKINKCYFSVLQHIQGIIAVYLLKPELSKNG